MPMITVVCTECNETVNIKDGRAGTAFSCPKCGTAQRVPLSVSFSAKPPSPRAGDAKPRPRVHLPPTCIHFPCSFCDAMQSAPLEKVGMQQECSVCRGPNIVPKPKAQGAPDEADDTLPIPPGDFQQP